MSTDKEKELIAWVKRLNFNSSSDYSQSFAGTKLDTILEKAYGEILKGVDDPENKDNLFPRQPCTCTRTPEGHHGSDCTGKWLRVLSPTSGCYLYVHTITHEITGTKPENYIPDEAKDAERQRKIEAALGKFGTFPNFHPENVFETVHHIRNTEGKFRAG